MGASQSGWRLTGVEMGSPTMLSHLCFSYVVFLDLTPCPR